MGLAMGRRKAAQSAFRQSAKAAFQSASHLIYAKASEVFCKQGFVRRAKTEAVALGMKLTA
jgi:hypothetical protein